MLILTEGIFNLLFLKETRTLDLRYASLSRNLVRLKRGNVGSYVREQTLVLQIEVLKYCIIFIRTAYSALIYCTAAIQKTETLKDMFILTEGIFNLLLLKETRILDLLHASLSRNLVRLKRGNVGSYMREQTLVLQIEVLKYCIIFIRTAYSALIYCTAAIQKTETQKTCSF